MLSPAAICACMFYPVTLTGLQQWKWLSIIYVEKPVGPFRFVKDLKNISVLKGTRTATSDDSLILKVWHFLLHHNVFDTHPNNSKHTWTVIYNRKLGVGNVASLLSLGFSRHGCQKCSTLIKTTTTEKVKKKKKNSAGGSLICKTWSVVLAGLWGKWFHRCGVKIGDWGDRQWVPSRVMLLRWLTSWQISTSLRDIYDKRLLVTKWPLAINFLSLR